jgi:hypothetical protein
VVLAAPLAAAGEGEEEWLQAPADDRDRLHLSAVGGVLYDLRGSGDAYAFGGGEVSWAFDSVDVGVMAQGYRLGDRARAEWTPILLLRLIQRFETRRGLEATLSAGVGAGRLDGWSGWYQFALGLRLDQGPLFLTGEVGFERLDLLRLGAGLGVKF